MSKNQYSISYNDEAKIFIKKYEELEQSFYSQNATGKKFISREIRLFYLRYTVALDLDIDIKTKYSRTKTDEVRNAYVAIFKFLTFWNVFKAGIKIAGNSKKWCGAFKNVLPTLYKNESIKNMETTVISFCTENKDKLIPILDRLKETATSKNVKPKITAITEKLVSNQNISATDFIFICSYARNAFYHAAETARQGTNYSFVKKLYRLMTESLALITAVFGAQLFDSNKK